MMRARGPSRIVSLLVLLGVIALVGGVAISVVAMLRLNRPATPVASSPAPLVAITYFPTRTPAVGISPPTVTAIAREREDRRASQMATSIARASATAAASSPTPASTRRIGARVQATAAPAATAFPATRAPDANATPVPPPTASPIARATPTVVPQAASPFCRQTEGVVNRESVASAGLNDTIPVLVAVPPCFDPAKQRYPAVYLLQGSGDIEGQWERLGFVTRAHRLMAAGELPPFLIVMPNNDIDMGEASKFLNSAEGPGSWEDFIVNDVVPLVDAKYAGWADPLGRAIGGISRGGYWSLEIAFRNPNVFGAVGGHSAVISGEYLVGASDDFRMTMMAHSPDDLKLIRIWLDVGDNDYLAITGEDDLAVTLSGMGVKPHFSIGSGGHEDAYWASRVDDYLAFYAGPWFDAAPIATKR
jgi:enterochelin esterase-like enzyme